MIVREVRELEKSAFNQVVLHPLQSWEWGDFRQETGVDVIRLGEYDAQRLVSGYQITFHSIPKLPFTIGYMPKCHFPSQEVITALKDLLTRKQAIFIKLESNVSVPVKKGAVDDLKEENSPFFKQKKFLFEQGCVYGKPMFTKYNFLLDLTSDERTLLAKMKQKTRYNIGLATRKGVVVVEDNSTKAFEEYLNLTFDVTTKRQKFYAHDREYHLKMWECMKKAKIAHLLKAVYEGNTLVTWIVFTFNKGLYYPYGASSSEHREVMASNLIMWEAIRFGKASGCTFFDMWGSLGPDPYEKDPWIGFHRFKAGYGPTLLEYIGTYDLVVDLPKYQVYTLLDTLRWKWLRLKAKLPF